MKKICIPLMFCLACISACKSKKEMTGNNNTASPTTAISTTASQSGKGSAAIDGNWHFKNFTTVNTSPSILFTKNTPVLSIDSRNSTVKGNSGCNSISGKLNISGENISFLQPMTTTEMICNSSGEKIFLDYLKAVVKYRINGNTLELIVGEKPVMVLEKITE